MKRWAVLLIFSVLALPGFSWQFREIDTESSDRLVVLEPDEWSQKQLAELKKQGYKPLAWLNVGEIEDWRLIIHEFKGPEEYAFLKRKTDNQLMLARFYGTAFRKIAQARVREYIHKGFAGIFFAGAGYYSKVSNSPINRGEMWSLLDRLAQLANSITAKPVLIIEGAEFFNEINTDNRFSGVAFSGLFRKKNRKRVFPWQRKSKIEMAKKLIDQNKIVLIAEMTANEQQKGPIRQKCEKLGIDCCFTELPLRMKRREKIDFTK
jgi:endo-alpha-1,4-polygalactosaminidase (GH114 family)